MDQKHRTQRSHHFVLGTNASEHPTFTLFSSVRPADVCLRGYESSTQKPFQLTSEILVAEIAVRRPQEQGLVSVLPARLFSPTKDSVQAGFSSATATHQHLATAEGHLPAAPPAAGQGWGSCPPSRDSTLHHLSTSLAAD